MAAVNLYGQAASADQAVLDCTHRRLDFVVSELLPRGRAWDREDPVLQALVSAEATELSRVDHRGRTLIEDELHPLRTFELLPEWEKAYGLPDCGQPTTLEGRRSALAAKLLSQAGHDQSLTYWTHLLSTLQYTLDFLSSGPGPMTCIDECTDVLFDEQWTFVWTVAVAHGYDDALLECAVRRNAWIGTLPVVHYLWTAEASGFAEALYAVACTPQGYVASVGSSGRRIYAGVDLTAWTASSSAASSIYAVCAHGDVLLAVGNAAVEFMRSTDNGASWSQVVTAAPTMYGISRGPLADLVVVAVGSGGAIWRSSSVGAAWTAMTSPTVQNLYAVTRVSGALVAVGQGGTILRSSDNGVTWVPVVTTITATLLGVSAWMNVVVAVGEAGAIARSADGGLTWTLVDQVKATLRAVTASITGRWAACGDGGLIVYSLDGGVTWTLQDSPTTEALYGACSYTPGGRILFVGNNGTIVLE